MAIRDRAGRGGVPETNGRKTPGNGKHPPEGAPRLLPEAVYQEVQALDIGARMRRAAQEAGLTADDLAREFNKKSPSTIRLWWREETSPSPRDLILYARLVGKPVDWFLGQPRLSERVLSVLSALMDGQPVIEAIEAVGGERLDIEEQTRALMEAGAGQARAALKRLANGRWASLSDEERLALVDRLMQETEADGTARAGPGASRPLPTNGALDWRAARPVSGRRRAGER